MSGLERVIDTLNVIAPRGHNVMFVGGHWFPRSYNDAVLEGIAMTRRRIKNGIEKRHEQLRNGRNERAVAWAEQHARIDQDPSTPESRLSEMKAAPASSHAETLKIRDGERNAAGLIQVHRTRVDAARPLAPLGGRYC